MGNQTSSPKDSSTDKTPKKSLRERMRDQKRSKPLSDEDILRATGKSRDELQKWASQTPGVGSNQLAGKLAMGGASGLGGAAAAHGLGGWGPSAEPNDKNRGMKFPPKKEEDVKE
ncbi:hypothetical protein BGZ63DRAFT_395236 [Mariannaea sp. PMI_226]|nr:hypothetical protein BGZ63DRAFT_395236 [Mariannaea sp. PMI_226]